MPGRKKRWRDGNVKLQNSNALILLTKIDRGPLSGDKYIQMIIPTKTYPIALCALLQISLLAGCAQTPPTAQIGEDNPAPLQTNEAKTMVELGEKYADGTGGFTKDEAKAVELFTKAANQGDAAGQDHLARMILFGRGTPEGCQ